MPRHWLRVALANFLIAAILGALLRFAFVEELPSWIHFRKVLHGHSHVAMLGWLYLAFYALLLPVFLSPAQSAAPFYRKLFWWTQASVVGMLVAFPLQGYGPFSIAFSQIHVFLSYAFVFRFWKDLRKQNEKPTLAVYLLKTALFFLVFSTLAL